MNLQPEPYTVSEMKELFPLLMNYYAKAQAFFAASLLRAVFAGSDEEKDQKRFKSFCDQSIARKKELDLIDHAIDCILHPPDGACAEAMKELAEEPRDQYGRTASDIELQNLLDMGDDD